MATMADDSMEISSDNGHNIAEDDIDIDFDFTAGQAEEDYMQDDTSVMDFGNNLLPQSSPLLGQDDLMMDEDNESFSMIDADTLQDDIVTTMDEPESMSFAVTEPPNTNEVDFNISHSIADPSVTDSPHYASETINIPDPVPSVELNSNSVFVVEKLVEDEVQISNEHNTEPAIHEEENTLPTSQDTGLEEHSVHVSRVNSPQTSTPKAIRSPVEVQSPSTSFLDPDLDAPASEDHGFASEAESKLTSTLDAPDNTEDIEPDHTGEDEMRNVVVAYRATEYSLFSSSELDDPDSFFLSDKSIINKPISHLFSAIRDVIREDLSDEDELCLTVESLGLETEEASTLLEDVTLSQILHMQEVLLLNDDVTSPPPLLLILGTRPNFSKRIRNLSEGAANGKGLSELIPWTEGSDSLEDGSIVHEHDLEFDTNEGAEAAEDEINYDETAETDNDEGPAVEDDHSVPSEGLTEHQAPEVPFETDDAHNLHPDTVATPSKVTATDASNDDKYSHPATSLGKDHSDSGEHEDDGDIIDYSEDESEEPKKQQKFANEKVNPEANRTEEHNENVRRLSISPENEKADEESHNPQEPHLETVHTEGNDDEYDEFAENNVENDGGEIDYEDHAGDYNNVKPAEGENEGSFQVDPGTENYHEDDKHDFTVDEHGEGSFHGNDEAEDHEGDGEHDFERDEESFDGEGAPETYEDNDNHGLQGDEQDGEYFEGEAEAEDYTGDENNVLAVEEGNGHPNDEAEPEEYNGEEGNYLSLDEQHKDFQEGETAQVDTNDEEEVTYEQDAEHYFDNEPTLSYEDGTELNADGAELKEILDSQGKTSEGYPANSTAIENSALPDFTNLDSHANSVSGAEAAESSVTLSADEIQYEDELDEEVFDNSIDYEAQALDNQAHTNGGSEEKDEIDYEDDEEDVDTQNTSSGKNDSSSLLNSPHLNQKRSRSVLESDDGPDMTLKDAKRRRS